MVGAALFILRLIQLRTGFDPKTGLALPSPEGRIVWMSLPVCLVLAVILSLRRSGESKRSYVHCFNAPGGLAMSALIVGSFLLIGSGVMLLLQVLPPEGTAETATAITGVLGIAGGAGLLLLLREVRGGEAPSVFPLLPVMFFSVIFLLAVYFPEEANPVLERYYLPVLGAVLGAYFLYQLAGFFRGEGNLCWFSIVGDLTVIVCVATAADCLDNLGRLLAYLGYAVIATVFLLLLRPKSLPEEAEDAA